MYEHLREASFPDSYARREIDCITIALAMRRSVRVVGLSGMGKSNLLRFLISHPQLITDHPDIEAETVHFLYLDCNKINPINPLAFFRECHFLLQPEAIPAQADEQLLLKQLELSLRQIGPETLVIMVLDRTEGLYEAVGSAFFAQLRNLRDEARAGRMAFIFGSARPLGNLQELEKLFSDTCWVRSLAEADQAYFFEHHQTRLNFRLEITMQDRLWQLTGGHPGLLKNAIEWVKRQAGQPEQDLQQGLLQYTPIQNYCDRLWTGLTETEQHFLLNISHHPQSDPVGEQLKQYGLLVEKASRLELFSPLWQVYLQQTIWSQQPVGPMEVRLEPTTRHAILHWRGQTERVEISRKLVFDLLQALAATPREVCSKDDLIKRLYGEENSYEMFEDPLFQLVTALRRMLDPAVRRLCPNLKGSCVQNVRGVGYLLQTDLPV